MSSTVVAGGVTATLTGSFSIWSARSAISRGMVAEKNSVCRFFGMQATIFRMSRMKPMSSMRSASSRTSTETPSKVTARLLWRSSRRPGVATRMSTPPRERADLLAHRHAADDQHGLQAEVAAVGRGSCRRSGRRVRASGTARGRAPTSAARTAPAAARRCRIGSAKAAVLPVPVWAMPMTSRPASAGGIAAAWIGVGAS